MIRYQRSILNQVFTRALFLLCFKVTDRLSGVVSMLVLVLGGLTMLVLAPLPKLDPLR